MKRYEKFMFMVNSEGILCTYFIKITLKWLTINLPSLKIFFLSCALKWDSFSGLPQYLISTARSLTLTRRRAQMLAQKTRFIRLLDSGKREIEFACLLAFVLIRRTDDNG